MTPQKKMEDKDRPGDDPVLELGGDVKLNFMKVNQAREVTCLVWRIKGTSTLSYFH